MSMNNAKDVVKITWAKLPAAEVFKGNHVLHLDLSSRVSYYLLGDYAFNGLADLVSAEQKKLVWKKQKSKQQ